LCDYNEGYQTSNVAQYGISDSVLHKVTQLEKSTGVYIISCRCRCFSMTVLIINQSRFKSINNRDVMTLCNMELPRAATACQNPTDSARIPADSTRFIVDFG